MNAITKHESAALYAALAAAQGAFLPIEKNRTVKITMKSGGTYNFRYADLEEINAKTRPALAANGLAVIQPMTITGTDARLTCELVHKDGGRVVSEVSIPHPHSIQDPKQFGATVSFFRRYMVQAMLNVAADDDLDEDGQGVNDIQNQPQGNAQKPPVNQPQRRAAPAKTQQEDKPADGAAATTGEIAYITKKIAAKGITVEEAQQMAGIEVTNTLNGLTKDGFVALKDALA